MDSTLTFFIIEIIYLWRTKYFKRFRVEQWTITCAQYQRWQYTHSPCFFSTISIPLVLHIIFSLYFDYHRTYQHSYTDIIHYCIYCPILWQGFGVGTIPSHENWPTQFQKLIDAFFNTRFLYLLLHISLPLLSQQIQREKKPALWLLQILFEIVSVNWLV